MQKTKLSMLLLSSLFAIEAQAAINSNYQYGQVTVTTAESTTIPITNEAITLNPAIDSTNPRDPRIKTLIDYVRLKGKGVSVVFYNPDNYRFATKLNEMFSANGIYATDPQLAKSKNMMEYNLVKIYAIENQNNKLESNSIQKYKK